MISVLIPVYNQDVTKLVMELSRQMSAIDKEGEIVVMDDGSDAHWNLLNKNIAQFPFVRYLENKSNRGRLRIRALLANAAKHDWLLFLDGDSGLVSNEFLLRYYRSLPAVPAVVVGGRIYTDQPPEDCQLHLHWRYGSIREAIDIHKKNKRPYSGFMSNNFLIHKSIADQLRFTGDWQGYGHEDSWMGIQLEQLAAPVQYIQNVVLHEGLESAPVFLAKTENALHNLHKLQTLVPVNVLKKHVRLYGFFCMLRSAGLLWLPGLLNRVLHRFILKNLYSCRPSLVLFDLYRLALFIRLTGTATVYSAQTVDAGNINPKSMK